MMDFARSSSPAVQAQLDRLALLSPGGDRLGLDRITRLLERLGRPQDRLPPIFHVAGTNGKGSTCAFVRAALEAAGHRVHVFTSPHLVRFNERIRLAGSLISDNELAATLGEVLDAAEGIEPSFFEVTTAAAFLAFTRTPADALVLEVGLGGRLDATNIVERPLVCGIAMLGIDHQQWLGKRLIDIAAEKAGIAKPGVPLVTHLYPRGVAERIAWIADGQGAPWLPRGGAWDAIGYGRSIRYRDAKGALTLPLPRLPGSHQARNAALAVAMLRHQERLSVPDSALTAAMGWAQWPARMQQLGPGPLASGREIWLDGAHNPAAARILAREVLRRFGASGVNLITASLKSKDPRGLLEPFLGLAVQVHTVPVADHDCYAPGELAGIANELGFEASPFERIADAVAAMPADRPLLILGSLYLAGEVLALNGEVPD
ncbi:bifunctional folylpolyglutamate synthase/dihydrofolate synthase [Sphingomonas sp. GCM10030256]|uniref:bifunctional folylpolyglutamate synthase/dihydrofolate synthase n=1 Tax=Sphingomonas sp. GCM10030256 TaxID=3273427 RepID=UPI00360CCB4F